MARLSLSLFGPFRVTSDGEPVTGYDSDKVRALLAYLAVEGERAHRRESLAGLLWPEWPEQSARKSLSNGLSNLRKVIGDRTATPPYLLISRETIQFNRDSDHWLDAAVFASVVEGNQASGSPGSIEWAHQLEEAVGLYRGDFLEGFSLADSAAFEDWALLERERLQRLILQALGQLAEHWEERGDLERALGYARRQVAFEPWGEEGHRRVMRLLALSGRRGAALAQYEACRHALAEELGVEPGPETARLYEQIREGEVGAMRATEGRGVTPADHPPVTLTPAVGGSGGSDVEDEPAQELPLLATKLYAPPPRPGAVSRPRLTQRLNEGLERRLTLISAPAGFGKTTLISEWRSAPPAGDLPCAWVSLDPDDNEPARFWTYVLAALGQVQAGLGAGVLPMLRAPKPPPIGVIMTALINEFAALSDPFLLVLDDYHVIEADPIHEALTFLLEHAPPQLHLAIASRADPPLPLHRLRGRGQLAELHAGDLRFTGDEAAAFLNYVMGLDLSADQISALEGHTEGWIAGLQMAALSMRGREDLEGFIAAFSGSHRYVVGYLVGEVLGGQSERVHDFLLRTSVLDRMCGPLCDALTGHGDGQATLEWTEGANLFTIPLDDERLWYRYHHLFADVLRGRLRGETPDRVPELHLRASEWYAAHGLPEEAVSHALAADDPERAADLVEGSAQTMWDRKNLARPLIV